MDIEKLKALKTAVEIGSITQAAEHMGYSQPGLTGMLKRLEQEVGYPLLRRGTKGVRLTEAGEAVMPYIDRVLESSRALERALADHAPARERILRIGSYTSITRGILPRSMKRFRQLYPDVQFTIRDGSCMDIEQWLVDGKIDIGLLSCCFTAPLDFVPLLNDPLYAVLPPEEDVGETVPSRILRGGIFSSRPPARISSRCACSSGAACIRAFVPCHGGQRRDQDGRAGHGLQHSQRAGAARRDGSCDPSRPSIRPPIARSARPSRAAESPAPSSARF